MINKIDKCIRCSSINITTPILQEIEIEDNVYESLLVRECLDCSALNYHDGKQYVVEFSAITSETSAAEIIGKQMRANNIKNNIL